MGVFFPNKCYNIITKEQTMDLKVIGAFIQSRRKAKNLTQVQLAQKLSVSEKTISKWECGNGFPDTSLMLPLCKALDITANELLSGKLLPTDKEYKEIAEQNLLLLKQERENAVKHLLTLEYVVGSISSIVFIILIFVASFCQISPAKRIVLILLGLAIFIIGIHSCLKIEKDAGYYECKICGHKYIPTYKSVLWSAHIGRTRFMKCPKCGKKSWNKKKINKD